MFLGTGGDDDASSVSSVSTQNTQATGPDESSSFLHLMGRGHSRSASAHSPSPRASVDFSREKVVLYREDQRVSLRAFLRTFLQNPQIAESKAMHEFLVGHPVKINEEEMNDIEKRKLMDEKRIEEQKRFYEIARERARELDIYMERFRRDIVERSMSTYEVVGQELTNVNCRWTHKIIQRDQRQREDRRFEPGVPKICRMAANRVSGYKKHHLL